MCDTVFEEWEELTKDYKELESVNETYLKKLKELTSYQQTCLKHIAHQRYRIKVISKNLKENQKTMDKDKVETMKINIVKREAELQVIEDTLPKQSSSYLKLILGTIDVSFLNTEAKFKYKDEYEKFKLISHIIAFVLASLNLAFHSRTLKAIYFFFLVWYYATATIRESILKLNGSRIKGWWRVHHFLSTITSGILLVWPVNDVWIQFKPQFMRYNLYNCFIQYLQFKYQRGALYRLKALGMRDNMDITIEGFHSWMWRGLTFLLPFLFGAYIYQLANAIVLYRLTYHPEATWHVYVLSAAFCVFFVGNTATTIMVVPNKIKNKMWLNYRVMTQRLYNMVNENIVQLEAKDKQT